MTLARPPRRRSPLVARLGLISLLCVLLLLGGGLATFLQVREQVQRTYAAEIAGMRSYRPPVNVEIYTEQGEMIDTFAAERRIWVDLDTLPPHVSHAFIAAEDRRFLEHPGVDLAAIARAFHRNWQEGAIREGGSTLTQQLAKNLVTGGEKSYARKLREAIVALELERQLSKHQLLELYVNQVYLGAGSYGIEAASRRYFRKPAAELDPGQAAMIAGVIPAPSLYNPEASEERARARRREILQAMVQEGWLDADQALAFSDDPVRVPPAETKVSTTGAAYKTLVRRELRRLFGQDLIFQEGLKVVVPFRPEIQIAAEEAALQATQMVQERHGYQGAIGRLPEEEREGWLEVGAGLPRDWLGHPRDPAPGDCFTTLVEGSLNRLRVGSHTYQLDRRDRGIRLRREPNRGGGSLSGRTRNGDLLRVCLPEDAEGSEDGEEPTLVRLDRAPWTQAGIVVLDNRTNGVVALVGGHDDVLEGFVRAVQSRRQPGSTFKVYVYGAALRAGHSQVDPIVDGPIAMMGGNGRVWAPRNYDGGFFGLMHYRKAFAYSRNTPAVKVAMNVGIPQVIETARLLGIRGPLREDPTIALGSNEVSPMEQALAMSTIARLGEYRDAVFIQSVWNMEGKYLGSAGDTLSLSDGTQVTLPGAPRQVLDPGVAYELADMMKAVMEMGTGARAAAPDHARYGKTGTTNNFTDAWFVGFNPDYSAVVWVGTDTPQSLGDRETGSRTAMPAWKVIMDRLPPDRAEIPLPAEAVVTAWGNLKVGLARKNLREGLLPRPGIDEGPLRRFPAPRPPIQLPTPSTAGRDLPDAPR